MNLVDTKERLMSEINASLSLVSKKFQASARHNIDSVTVRNRKVIDNFVTKNLEELVESDLCVFHAFSYYQPITWKLVTDSDYKRCADYVVNKCCIR